MAGGAPHHPEVPGETPPHLSGRQRGRLGRVPVQAPAIQRPPVAVLVDGAVGDHVVVVGERVERPAGEVPERRRCPPPGSHRLATCPRGRRVRLEVCEAEIVAGLDGVEHGAAGGVVAEEREDAEGLLGGEGEVVADPHRGGMATFQERDKVATPHTPVALVVLVGGEERPSRCAALGHDRLDLHSVGDVAMAEPTQVLDGYAGEPRCFGRGQQLVGGTEPGDPLGFRTLQASILTAAQLRLGHPPVAVRVDSRDQVCGVRFLLAWAGVAPGGEREQPRHGCPLTGMDQCCGLTLGETQ